MRSVPKEDLIRLVRKISSLAINPNPVGSVKITGEEYYRIRQGSWRAVYSIDENGRVVRIIKVGHRKEVYR